MSHNSFTQETLQKAIAERERLAGELERVERIIGLLGATPYGGVSVTVGPPQAVEDATQRYILMSAPEAAEDVLKRAGKPMHVMPIVHLILRGGYPYEKGEKKLRASLTSSLIRQERFYRAGRARFGLSEWKKKETEMENATSV